MSGAVSILLHELRLDGGTQARAVIDPVAVERYAEAVDALPPLDVFHDGESYWLADGFHRVAALQQCGRDMFVAHVHQGTQRDAVLYACGANADHGLPRTTADARRAVERLLGDEEWRARSDRWIAETCRVSPTTVGRVRAELGATADVREVTRGGSTYQQNVRQVPPEPASVHGGQIDRGTFQAPEPDNTVRTPVEREHKGKALTAGDHAAMRALSATWPREKLAERFRVELAEVDRILDAPAPEQEGPAPRAEALSQFFTPTWLAAKMVELAGLRAGDTVLEPSGGRGALVRAILDAFPAADVVVYELDPRMVAELRTIDGDVEVIEGSYLDADEGSDAYPAAVMNPPYENGLDGLFLAKACAEACCVVALVRANIFYGSTRFRSVWAKYGKHLTAVRHVVARPDFTEGTPGVHGAMSDFVVIRLDDLDEDWGPLDGLARPTVDWWLEPEGDAS